MKKPRDKKPGEKLLQENPHLPKSMKEDAERRLRESDAEQERKDRGNKGKKAQ